MKDKSEFVWPVENYTDKIHQAIKIMFSSYPWLSFTLPQMKTHLIRGYSWLVVSTDQQKQLLDKIIHTAIKKLIQAGKVKKVTSKVSVDDQWQSTVGTADSGMINVTSEDSVAHTEAAMKAIGRRAVGARSLHKFNQEKPKFDILH
jgi:hypothetical protein